MTSLRLRLLLLHSALSASSMAAECGDDSAAIAPISPIDPPLLLRAARGEAVERTPVWMMRQAGRHMQVYRDLIKEYPTFRDRSETPEVSFEVSMQPYRAYKTDGVILFSDILTPLPAMGVDFSISEKGGIQVLFFVSHTPISFICHAPFSLYTTRICFLRCFFRAHTPISPICHAPVSLYITSMYF